MEAQRTESLCNTTPSARSQIQRRRTNGHNLPPMRPLFWTSLWAKAADTLTCATSSMNSRRERVARIKESRSSQTRSLRWKESSWRRTRNSGNWKLCFQRKISREQWNCLTSSMKVQLWKRGWVRLAQEKHSRFSRSMTLSFKRQGTETPGIRSKYKNSIRTRNSFKVSCIKQGKRQTRRSSSNRVSFHSFKRSMTS